MASKNVTEKPKSATPTSLFDDILSGNDVTPLAETAKTATTSTVTPDPPAATPKAPVAATDANKEAKKPTFDEQWHKLRKYVGIVKEFGIKQKQLKADNPAFDTMTWESVNTTIAIVDWNNWIQDHKRALRLGPFCHWLREKVILKLVGKRFPLWQMLTIADNVKKEAELSDFNFTPSDLFLPERILLDLYQLIALVDTEFDYQAYIAQLALVMNADKGLPSASGFDLGDLLGNVTQALGLGDAEELRGELGGVSLEPQTLIAGVSNAINKIQSGHMPEEGNAKDFLTSIGLPPQAADALARLSDKFGAANGGGDMSQVQDALSAFTDQLKF